MPLERPSPTIRLEPIPRVAAPDGADFFQDYVKPRRPVILTGLTGDWPALRRWSPAYFQEYFGNCRVPAAITRSSGVAADADHDLVYVDDTVADTMKSIVSGASDARYLAGAVELFPDSLKNDFRIPSYCEGAAWIHSKIWAGAAGMRSPLHRDIPHNLYAQVVGRKTFALFPPEQARNLYPHSLFSRLPNGCRPDIFSPDAARYPRLGQARGLTGLLEPGDVLFLPSLWWHQTRAETASISINFWWARGGLAWLARASDLAKRAMGLSR